jgi:eukaryotic-like serine/threonine-protein kinase
MKHPVRPGAMAREENIFDAALQLADAAERNACLDQACAGDTQLRARVEKLLAVANDPFFNTPATPGRLTASEPKMAPTDFFSETPSGRIGRYKLLDKIGEGGCGVVYMAEQEEPVRRRVALKVIKLGMDTRSVISRFEAERQALAMMDHPNIARVLDAGATEAGRPFFVMELVRGTRITDYCDQNNLTIRARLALFMQVCHAIQHAHQKGIIHRDVKPSNILVTLHDGEPVPKVIDFGIAKATTDQRLTDKTLFTALEQFIGTPAYMSPEQAEMSGLDIDTRSDIYSLGVLLYELLTGQTPFDSQELLASGVDEMRRTIREKQPVRPSTRLSKTVAADVRRLTSFKSQITNGPPPIDPDLDWIVMKCLEKDRARRYETANGLAMDIQRHLRNEPIIARPPSHLYQFKKTVHRNKLAFGAAAAVTTALLLGLAISSWQMVAARRARNGEQQQRLQAESAQKISETERQRADEQARNASDNQERLRRLLYASDMNLAQQAVTLNNLGNARRLLDRHRPKPAEEDLRGWEWRYLWQLSRSTALVTLTNRPTRGFYVSFSPDGTRLAAGWWDGQVDLWDVPGRRLIRNLTKSEYGHNPRVAFSPVGHLLAATSGPKVVTLHHLDSGRESILWRAPGQGEWAVKSLTFSRDGSKLVIYVKSHPDEYVLPSNASDEVWVVDVASAKVENRQTTGHNDAYLHGAAHLSADNRRLYMGRSDSFNYRYTIQCINLTTGAELWQTEAQRGYGLTTLAISPDDRLVASGSGYDDPTIRIWDAATGHPLARLEGHTAWVAELVFTSDGRLVSAGGDQSIRFWETNNWTETQVLRGHTDEIHSIAISERAQLVASAGADGNLMLWKDNGESATYGYRRLPEELGVNQVLSVAPSSVLLLPADKPPQLFDLKRELSSISLPEHTFSRNVLGWFGANVLCLWNGTNQILVHELRGQELVPIGAISLESPARPAGFAYHPKRQMLAWTEGSSPTTIYLATLPTPNRHLQLKSDVPGLVPFRFSEDGTYLAAVGKESLRAWKVDTGEIVAAASRGDFCDATFAAGGQVLVVAIKHGNDHEIEFYDLAHHNRPPRRVPGEHTAGSVTYSSANGLVAVSTQGSVVRLFDPIKGEGIEDLRGHLSKVWGVAFSADGRRLISTSRGREAVKLWDVRTRQELLTLGGSGSLLTDARWSADGDVILVGPPWQAWRAPSWKEIAAAEAEKKTNTN